MSNGFVQIQRELLRHPSVLSAPYSHRWVLMAIIEYCCFKPYQMDDHGQIIDLLPGQCMFTLRDFANHVNAEKNDIERALARFSKCEILRHEVRHRKTIVTMLWGINKQNDETIKETKVRQERDIKEECNKEIRNGVAPFQDLALLDREKDGSIKKTNKSGEGVKYPLSVVIYTPKKEKVLASLEEYFQISVNNKFDYSTEEIEEAWIYLCDYKQPISNWVNFISYRIDHKRFNLKRLKKKDKKTCKTIITRCQREEGMKKVNRNANKEKKSPTIYKKNISGNVTSGQILQDLVSQTSVFRL